MTSPGPRMRVLVCFPEQLSEMGAAVLLSFVQGN